MIFFNQAEIMFGFVGIPAVLLTLHKLYPAITCEKFNAGIAGSLFCTTKILLCRDKLFSCNRWSPLIQG